MAMHLLCTRSRSPAVQPVAGKALPLLKTRGEASLRSGPAADVITSFQQLLHGGQGCLEALGLLLLLMEGCFAVLQLLSSLEQAFMALPEAFPQLTFPHGRTKGQKGTVLRHQIHHPGG